MTRESRIINSMNRPTPIAPAMILPNNSGDHVRSIKRDTPTDPKDLVNKEYIDNGFTVSGTGERSIIINSTTSNDVWLGLYDPSGLSMNWRIVNDEGVYRIQSSPDQSTWTNRWGLALSGNVQNTGTIDMNNKKITTLATPTANTDATTKLYVDGAIDTDVATHVSTAQAHSDYMLNTGDTATGDYNFSSNTLFIDDSESKVGIGQQSPDSKLHIWDGTAGTVAAPGDAVLTLERNNSVALQFLSPNTGANSIYFGDPQSVYAGYFQYSHATNALTIAANGGVKMTIKSDGAVDVVGAFTAGTIQADNGASGNFTTVDGKTVTVVGGIITSIV